MTPPQLSELRYEAFGHVALLTINRPERLNAWTPQLEAELKCAIEYADADPTVRCAVLTGAGRAFCAGMDMQVLSASQNISAKAPWQSTSDQDADQRYGYLFGFGKVLICAINGAAAGVGLCLSLYCDLRYVADGAKLTFPYSRRGLVAEHGTAWLLPRLIGQMHAADLLLSGRTFLADEAQRMGLANLLPADRFLDAVMARAQDIATSTSPRSVRVSKRQLLDARYQTFGMATHVADLEVAKCRNTDDFKEGVRHFLEKRAPRFTGN